MAVTIDKSGADTWFAADSHIQSPLWFAFDDEQRDAAVAHAKNILTRALGSTITSESTESTESYYPDRAAYEQALYMLLNSDAIPNGEQTGPKHTMHRDDDEPRKNPYAICSEARRWMDWQTGSTITISRG